MSEEEDAFIAPGVFRSIVGKSKVPQIMVGDDVCNTVHTNKYAKGDGLQTCACLCMPGRYCVRVLALLTFFFITFLTFWFSAWFSKDAVLDHCQNLKTKPGPGLGNLERSTSGNLALKVGSLSHVQLHIFYRFTGRCHGHVSGLGAVSIVQALKATPWEYRLNITFHVLMNGFAAENETGFRDYHAWFSRSFDELSLKNYSLAKVASGNSPSYMDMVMHHVREVVDVPDAVALFLEEDYWVGLDIFTKLMEFWAAYDPCFAAPYDYPDRYERKDNIDYGQTAVLETPGMHWRTVESTTVTFACRLDLAQKLSSQLLPAPWDDWRRSRHISKLYGIWTPIPALAYHITPGLGGFPCGLVAGFGLDCIATQRILCQGVLNLNFPEAARIDRWCSSFG